MLLLLDTRHAKPVIVHMFLCYCCCCCERLPYFQELLLLLDEYWARHPQLQGIPIYQASGVARKALNVFATYVAMMNQDIQKAIQVGGQLLHGWQWPWKCLAVSVAARVCKC
jgi:hypothetical protein